MKTNTQYIHRQDVCARGWSVSMVKKLLGEPDKIDEYRYHVQYMYSMTRIEKAEKSHEFKVLQEKFKKRSEAGKKSSAKAAETKKLREEAREEAREQELIADVLTYDIDVELIDNVVDAAISAYNNWQDIQISNLEHKAYKSQGRYSLDANGYETGDDDYDYWMDKANSISFAKIDDCPLFLSRITVNFIRHQLASITGGLCYDYVVEELNNYGAAKTLKNRVLDEIAKVYPQYTDECKRQRND